MGRFQYLLHKLFRRPNLHDPEERAAVRQGYMEATADLPPPGLSGAAFKKGDFIGQNYEVCAILGMGGFGVVYQVYSHELKEVFALKTLRDDLLNDDRVRELFRREAKIWVDMERHPYLVRAHRVEEFSHRLYIVMEYIAPGDTGLNSLQGYLQLRPPDLMQSLCWAIQFCYGMEYAYSKGLRCHRDIKPLNIMISSDNAVKISDFGLAGVVGTKGAIRQTGRTFDLDRTGDPNQTFSVGGTPTHMSPEQFIDSASCDQRSDIYSFGVVLYEMASGGRLPFFVPVRSASEEERARWSYLMFRLHAEAPVPRLDSKLFPIIRRCLEKRPQKRYPTFGHLRADLESLLSRCGGETIKPPSLEDLTAWEWGNKGLSLHTIGRTEEALQCYDRSLALGARRAVIWANKAVILRGLNRLEEARKCFCAALKLDPTQVQIWLAKGHTLAELGRHQESIQCYDRALKAAKHPEISIGIRPWRAVAWFNRATSLQLLGRFAEAIACCDEALKFDPNYGEAWSDKGHNLQRLGRYEEALPCFEKAIEIDNRNPTPWFNKGAALHRLDHLEEALACYQHVLELNRRYPDVWWNKALAEEELGQLVEAAHSYEQVILLSSANRETQVQQARKRLSELRDGRNG